MTHSRRVGQKVKLHKTSNSPRTIVDSESLVRNSVSVSECSVGIRSIQIIGVKRAETIRHITQPNLPTEFRYKNIKPKESSIKLLNIIYEPQPKCPCVAGEYHAYYFNNLLNQKMCLALWAWEKAWRERERVAPSTLIHHDKIQQRGKLKKIIKKKYFHSRHNVAASRGRKRIEWQTDRERDGRADGAGKLKGKTFCMPQAAGASQSASADCCRKPGSRTTVCCGQDERPVVSQSIQ